MKKQTSGFTLIEVLLALSVIAIALTALLLATSQSIKGTAQLQNKMLGHLVTTQALARLQLNLTPLGKNQETTESMVLFGTTWSWHAKATSTNTQGLEQIEITANPAKNNTPTDTLTSFRYTP
jgi:general secretion pathway protein I